MSKYAAVIAHHDQNGDVPLDLYDLTVEASKSAKEVYFVSTNINEASRLRISKIANLITRDNFGWDFWSYKVGIEAIANKQDIDSLLIINSSIIYLNPEKILSRFLSTTPSSTCLKGLTHSKEIIPHLQSFWIQFNGNDLINSDVFKNWWREMSPISTREAVIVNYEIGMSRYFQEFGIPLYSFYKPTAEDQLLATCRSIGNQYTTLPIDDPSKKTISLDIDLAEKLNPTSLLWDVLMERYDFVKAKMFSPYSKDYRPFGFLNYLLNKPLEERERIIGYMASRGIQLGI